MTRAAATRTVDAGSAATIGQAKWTSACRAAAILAVDPIGLGGASVRAAPGPLRDLWLAEYFRVSAPNSIVKLPPGVGEDRLLGGLDVAATLVNSAPVAETGLLAKADGGVLLAPMAERQSPRTAAIVAAAMDVRAAAVERSGVSLRDPARFSLLLLDEGADETEAPPAILLERVAFLVDLDGVSVREARPPQTTTDAVSAARARLSGLEMEIGSLEAIAATAARFGLHSMRILQFCMRSARAAAALDGDAFVSTRNAEEACALVLGPRAFAAPQSSEVAPSPPSNEKESPGEADDQRPASESVEDLLVEAVRSAQLAHVLDVPARSQRRKPAGLADGKRGAEIASFRKGRPAPARAGKLGSGARIDLLATLRAAAPWRKTRVSHASKTVSPIRPEDIRTKRFRARAQTVVIFAVDASGSSAIHRLAEAKGAIEYMLSDCYSRRDHVALVAFRGKSAELLLPPTRSLVRVRRRLSELPGGGATPLAAGVAAAAILAETEARKGRTPLVAMLSDGRGNMSLAGEADRTKAEADLTRMARRLKAAECASVFLDISPRPSARAQALAEEMGARYHPLPYAAARSMADAVKSELGTIR